mmetsp:Transcript_16789/g.28496  ORF Transcript_16789/g.28496 Transcript_16789/m.28496 type:complete len:150 (+) Transcript_16789:583-1032(+)
MVTPIVFIYPTTKRFFKFPQLVLGSAFNSGIMIGFAAASCSQVVNWQVCAPFYLGGILWTLIYDTIYAFQDREFDKRLGLNSAAIQMEERPHLYLSLLSLASVACFGVGGFNAGFGSAYYAGLASVASHFAWQMKRLNIESPQVCGQLF